MPMGVGLHTKTLLQRAKTFFNGATELHGQSHLYLAIGRTRDLFLVFTIQRRFGSFKDTIFIEPSPLTRSRQLRPIYL
jgi:hypothetical protein